MELGIFAATFGSTTPEVVLRKSSEAGFDVVQYDMACSGLSSMPDDLPPEVVEAASSASQKQCIRLAAVSGVYNMAHPDLAVRAKGMRNLKTLAASCDGLGTSLITLSAGSRNVAGPSNSSSGDARDVVWSDLLVEMEKAISVAEAYDSILASHRI